MRVFYRWFLTQLCNKYFLKKREVISLDKSRIQQLLNFSLLTRASTQLGREFGVIFPHYFSSSSAGDRAPLEYPILLLLQYAKMNCLWRKITPYVEFAVSFFSSWFDSTWLKVSSCLRIHIRMHAVVHHFFFLPFTFCFFPSFVVIKCSFIILFILYFWNRNENTHWCKSWCLNAYFINSTFCCFNIHF